MPSNTWGGQGLLGVSIRFCSFEGASENIWHVLVSGIWVVAFQTPPIKQPNQVSPYNCIPNYSIGFLVTEVTESFTLSSQSVVLINAHHTFTLSQEVHPNSPAAQAGLIPHTDYILGSDAMVGDDDLYSLIENNNHKEIRLFVYNSDSDACREVGGPCELMDM